MSLLVSIVIAQNQGGKMSNNKLFQLFDATEEIGVISSPSSTTKLALDILGQSVHKNLVGELVMCRFMQDSFHHYTLGQITEITLKNIWLEGPTIRSLVRERGQLDAISEIQDTHQGEMNISATFVDENGHYKQSALGTVPSTKTHIRLVDDDFLNELLLPYEDQIFYLGTVYGSTPKLPLWFKHFGKAEDGGLGEAHHLGIFGKTGSGKSVLAKMILLAYARHPQMGLFVLDPVGEFSKGMKDESGITSMDQILSPKSLEALNREHKVFDITNFRLDTWELFCQLLYEFGFFRELGIPNASKENLESAIDYTQNFLESSRHNLGALEEQAFIDLLNHLHESADRIYTSSTPRLRLETRITEAIDGTNNLIKNTWNKTTNLFTSQNNKMSIWNVVSNALGQQDPKQQNSRPLVVVNLAKTPNDIDESIWEYEIKPLLIDRFLNILTKQAQQAYIEDQSLNTLVVLDEAQRLAPRGSIESDRKNRIRARLVDAAKTTRKFGLGWMFISLTLSSLDREIIDSGIRSFFFGYGLGVGTELQALRDLVGRGESSKALELYQRFRDPGSHRHGESRQYSFMATGPVSPLSFGATPLFLNAFTESDKFLQENKILFP